MNEFDEVIFLRKILELANFWRNAFYYNLKDRVILQSTF